MRLVELANRVARELGCSDRQIEDIRRAARLHDIGKRLRRLWAVVLNLTGLQKSSGCARSQGVCCSTIQRLRRRNRETTGSKTTTLTARGRGASRRGESVTRRRR